MSSATTAFGVATFPGLVLNKVVREYYVRKHDVPVETPDVREITAMLEEEKEKKGREEEFGENTAETVRRANSEEEAYVNFYDLEEYEGLLLATSVPFLVSSWVGFVFLLSSVLLFGVNLLYGVLPFWLGVAFAAHSLPDEVAADALWQRSSETDSSLRFVGYPVAAVSKLSNSVQIWARLAHVLLLLIVAWYVLALP